MGEKLRNKILLSIGFGGLIYIVMTVFADVDNVLMAYRKFPWEYLPVIFLCSSMNYVFRFWKWDFFTKQLGIRPQFKQNLIIFFASFVMAVTPGKVGEVMKSYLLKKENGTPIRRSAPIILAERLTDFIGLIILVIAGAWMFGYGRSIVAVFTIFFFGITALLGWRKGSLALIAQLEKIPFVSKFAHHFHDGYDSIYTLFRLKPLTYSVAISVASWFFESLGFWIILDNIGAPPNLFKSAFIYSFSTIVGAVTMSPGGLGATEGSLTGLTMAAGASSSVAVASTFIIRTATLWYAVVLGAIIMIAFQKRIGIKLDELDLKNVMEEPSIETIKDSSVPTTIGTEKS